jgi:PAS domain S-box-containing protein
LYYGIILEKLSLLIVLCVISFFITKKWNKDKLLGKIFHGLLFGIITVSVMLNPLVISKGLIFDARSILISLSALYFGFITAFLATTMAIICRIIQGGIGALTGILIIILSFMIGIIGYYIKKRKNITLNTLHLSIFGFIVHSAMLLMLFTLPYNIAINTIKKLWIVVLFIYPSFSVILSKILHFQDEIIESEKKYKSLFYHSPLGIVITNKEGMAVQTNKSIQRMLDYSEKEFKSISFKDVTHHDDLKKDQEMFENLLAGKIDRYSIEKRYIKKDKSELWCNLTVFTVYNTNSIPNLIIAMIQDINKSKLAEIELKKSEERFRQLFENMQEGGQIIDFDWKYVFINKSAETQNKRPKEEILGKRVMDVWPGIDKTEVFKLEKRCMEERTAEHIPENEFIFPDGSRGWYTIDIQPVTEGIFILSTDVTQRKMAEFEREKLIINLEASLINEQSAMEEMEASYEEMETIQLELTRTNLKLEDALKQANAANFYKTEFLGNMSHEIRTPLTAILGYSSLMLEDKNLNDDQKENISLIHKSGKRLMELIVDILQLSQIEAGKTSINKKTADIEKIIENIKEMFSLKLKSKNLRFTTNLNGIKYIHTDPQRLSQILINLVGNSIKFTNKGKIKVELKIENNNYFFSVSDTGIGIKDELSNKIFDSFIMGETGFTKRYEGTGLGLTICKKLTELMGGKIWYESKPESGTTFYFTLTAEKKHSTNYEAEKINSETQNNNPIKKLKIAIVDDEYLVLNIIDKAIALKTKHSLKTYLSAVSFLNEFKNDNFDIIILDIRMPEMNGIDCIKEIRKTDTKVLVIAFTAFATENEKTSFLKESFDDVISKPLEVNSFIHKINEYAQNCI